MGTWCPTVLEGVPICGPRAYVRCAKRGSVVDVTPYSPRSILQGVGQEMPSLHRLDYGDRLMASVLGRRLLEGCFLDGRWHRWWRAGRHHRTPQRLRLQASLIRQAVGMSGCWNVLHHADLILW